MSSDEQNDPKPVSSLAIKLNNFALWASSGCALPYLSIYFLHYAQATSGQVGIVMSLSSTLGTLLNLILCSLSDRYRAHRNVYICILIGSFLVYSLLLIPAFADNRILENDLLEMNGTSTDQTFGEQIESKIEQHSIDLMETERSTLVMEQPIWFYLIAICLAIGTILADNLLIFSESFSANIATRCGQSYGSVKFWGALGLCSAALTLSLVHYILDQDRWKIHLKLPYLALEFSLFTLLSASNIMLVLFWRDKRPFNLSSNCDFEKQVAQKNEIQLFKHSNDQQVVRLRGITQWFRFDSQDDGFSRNVRRCSLAPIGDSGFVVKQYELHSTCQDQSEVAAKKTTDNLGAAARYKFVTKIETNAKIRGGQYFDNCETNKELAGYCKHVGGKIELRPEIEEARQTVSFGTHLKIIKLIARQDKDMVRFMLLYMTTGFIVAQNWVYLFPYLKQLNSQRFHRLASFVMISGYLSETVFYYVSSKITTKVSHAQGLSVILFMLALRNALYLAMDYLPWLLPIESIVFIELLQAPTMGWFNCVFNEASLEFARNHQARLEKGLDYHGPGKDMDVKLTLLGISAFCFEGIGVGLGSFIGGWLIDLRGFPFLWLFVVCLSLSGCCLNLLADICLFRDDKGKKFTKEGENNLAIGAV